MIPQLDTRYRWYSIPLKDEHLNPCVYYFRGITAGELRVAGTKASKFEAEDFILKKVVANTSDWPNMLAGVAAKLLKEIYRISGLDEEGLTFTEAVNWIQSEVGSLEAAAIAMIPSATPAILETCDPFHYAKYLVMGKFQFETMYGVPVEQAFSGKKNNSNAINTMPNPGPAAAPRSGEVARQVEDSFTWKRQN